MEYRIIFFPEKGTVAAYRSGEKWFLSENGRPGKEVKYEDLVKYAKKMPEEYLN